MAHLAHTEYELRGRSSLDVRDVLRETMFAATVTGSPVQNACRVIERHEVGGRGYYAGALALVGRQPGDGPDAGAGAQTLDSPILIRTADIDADGRLRVPVGATLVRGSDPAGEVAETHAKAAGVLAALGVLPGRPRPDGARPKLGEDPRVRASLDGRRASLAPFWLRMQERSQELAGHALVVDAEDTFTAMLAHLLRSSGLDVTVRRYDEPGLREAVLAHEGPVVLGPGPGDPSDPADPKMRFLRTLTAEVLREHRHGVLGVCLGHELIAAELGLDIVRKDVPYQGAQTRVDLFGRAETVGFYNSFVARCDDDTLVELRAHGVEVSRAANGEVHALRGPGFAGVQFHPESVLTLNGAAVVRELTGQLRGTSTFSERRPSV
jgi:phenazine biosynthesis protein phzE